VTATVGMVEVGVVDTRYGVSQTLSGRGARAKFALHTRAGWRGDGYQRGLDWGRFSIHC